MMRLWVFLMVLGATVVVGEECVNYVNGSEYVTFCSYGCCLTNGSFAVNLEDEVVCREAVDADCDSEIPPTSCPIIVNGERKMYGCGYDETCCHGNVYDIYGSIHFNYTAFYRFDICSDNGFCAYYDEDYNDNEEEDYEPVTCYECRLLEGFHLDSVDSLDLIEGEAYGIDEFCSRRRQCEDGYVCYSHRSTVTANIIEPISGQPLPIEAQFLEKSCAPPDFDDTLAVSCSDLWEEGIRDALYDYDVEDISASCSNVEMCAADCVEDDSEEMETWVIILIIVLIILLIAVSISCFVILWRRHNVRSVSPTRDQERSRRLREVSGYLTEAISARDVADLRLSIDIVERENFQEPLKGPYRQARALFEELMARDAEQKRRELEEEERRAALAKKTLADAEEEVLKRRPPLSTTTEAEQEEARLAAEALLAREAARVRWKKQWPRLQIMRALNSVNEEAVAKAVEAARLQREEEERLAREAALIEQCRAALQQGLDSGVIAELESGIKMTDDHQLEGHDQLCELYEKAQDRLEKERAILARKLQEEEDRKAEEAFRLAEEQREAEAKRLAALSRLQEIRAALNSAVSSRDIAQLKSAMKMTEDNNLLGDLEPEYKAAFDLLARLEKMEIVKRKIMELDRPLIAELKSFSVPPTPVLRAMVGSYLLMGENEASLREWGNIVILLNKTGKLSVKRRVQELQVEAVTDEVARKAREQIMGLTSEEVYEANQAASLFFDWTEMICYERQCLSDNGNITDVV